ncbi:MAG: hypothetical protein OEZ04_14085 [Nitrospinota bacterium]|nr:hypothetical protein [Nitrospinota bacterium]
MKKTVEGVVFIALLGVTGLFIISLPEASGDIKVGFLSISGAVILAIYANYNSRQREIDAHRFIKMREIEARHFADKQQAYLKYFNIVFEELEKIKKLKSSSADTSSKGEDKKKEKLQEDMMEFKKGLMTWGSSKAIRAWNDFEMLSGEGPIENQQPEEKIKEFNSASDNFLRVIREDLGHDDSSLKPGSLWGLILNAKSKRELFEQLKDQ